MCARMRNSQIQSTGLLGVREGHRREVGVRFHLLCNEADVGKAGLVEHLLGQGCAHTVHSGQGDGQIFLDFRASLRQRCGASNVVLARIHIDDQLVVLSDLIGERSRSNRRSDLGIEGRNDLDALAGTGHDGSAQVDLVAVVARRVVRCGDHDARIGVQLAHGECGERGGVLQRKQEHFASCCRGHACSCVGKIN